MYGLIERSEYMNACTRQDYSLSDVGEGWEGEVFELAFIKKDHASLMIS